MRKIFTAILMLFAFKSFSQNLFFVNGKSYQSTNSFSLSLNTDYNINERGLECIIAKKGLTGIIAFSKQTMTPVSIKGNIIMYLNDGSTITLIDRGIYDYVDETATTVYYLTAQEIEKLKKVNLLKVRFALKCSGCMSSEEGNFTATNNTNIPSLIEQLFPDATKNLPQPFLSLNKGWQRILIKNCGSIDIPPTLEIQSNNYRTYQNEYFKQIEIDTTILIIQQNGLNDLNTQALKKYARILIETTIGKEGQFEKLNFDINSLKQEDITDLNAVLKEQTLDYSGDSFKLLTWYPVKIERVNGMSCVHVKYERKINDEIPVLVHVFMFQNYSIANKLTLSYRISEKEYWESDFEKVLQSFRILTIH